MQPRRPSLFAGAVQRLATAAGRWHTQPAQQYIAKVRQYLRQKLWKTKDFQQP